MGEIVPMGPMNSTSMGAVNTLGQAIKQGNSGWRRVRDDAEWFIRYHSTRRVYEAVYGGLISETTLHPHHLSIKDLRLFDINSRKSTYSPYLYKTHRSMIESLLKEPVRPAKRVRCGKEFVEWDFAVVWVVPKDSSISDKKHKLLFASTPTSNANVSLQQSVHLTDQWHVQRGLYDSNLAPTSHEVRRGKQMACQVIATFRRKYLKKHRAAPAAELLTGGQSYKSPNT